MERDVGGQSMWVETRRGGGRRARIADAARTRLRDDRYDQTRYASITRLGARYDPASARGRASRTCRRDVSEGPMARRARAHHGRGSRQTSRRVRSTVDAQTPRVGRCVRSRFAFAEETTSLRVRRRRCARARVPRAIRRLRGRASRAIGPPRVDAFSREKSRNGLFEPARSSARGNIKRHSP